MRTDNLKDFCVIDVRRGSALSAVFRIQRDAAGHQLHCDCRAHLTGAHAAPLLMPPCALLGDEFGLLYTEQHTLAYVESQPCFSCCSGAGAGGADWGRPDPHGRREGHSWMEVGLHIILKCISSVCSPCM